MKILLVNKFLYPKGGAETYLFKLGETLVRLGHEVEYFGLEHEKNIVKNRVGVYVSHLDFHEGIRKNWKAPFRILYSGEARRKIRKVLEDFQPDVVHLNNIQYHLTPSILLEAEAYRRKYHTNLKIVYTVHDYQLVCPSHGFFDAQMHLCRACLDGHYWHCVKGKCIAGSVPKSILGMLDSYLWKYYDAYRYVDAIICPSQFLKEQLDTQPRFAKKTIMMRNFTDSCREFAAEKDDYVLMFGRLTKEKGTGTLLEVCRRMPHQKFIFAGEGEYAERIRALPNAKYVGFRTGETLKTLIQKALCTVCASEIYENCPFSVLESQMYGTPVVGSRIGGIPELIREGETGALFVSGDADSLETALRILLETPERLQCYTEACRNLTFETAEQYAEKLMSIYGGTHGKR